MAHKNTVRVVDPPPPTARLRIRDYPSTEPLLEMHSQVGVDDCSDRPGSSRAAGLSRLNWPECPRGRTSFRYESPDVFETLTKEWSSAKNPRRRRRMQPPTGNWRDPLPAMNVAQTTTS